MDETIVEDVRRKFNALMPVLNERARRHWASVEADSLGYGGVSAVAQATGLSRVTITAGMRELRERAADPIPENSSRIRQPGGGRKRASEADPELMEALEGLVEPGTRGDPESPLRWTIKSTQRLADELTRQGHSITARTVASLLREADYSLQSNRKTREGNQHTDRNAQFEYINDQVRRFHHCGQPTISVDTKKKELIGDFKNDGREWRPKGEPEIVRVHDFKDKILGKGIPYGVYDMLHNEGWVSVGIDHDTARFAANSILSWWREMGSNRFPRAKRLLITADGGGSNSHRTRLWKIALQELANETGLKVVLCHFPPGTSKWNKIEHRLFSHITQNWRGKPLTSLQAIINLITSTTTKTGLTIQARADNNTYETGIKVTDQELAAVNLTKHKTHGSWNYTISPKT